jgi:hypothetical protein
MICEDVFGCSVKDGLEKMRNRKTGWEVTPSKKW